MPRRTALARNKKSVKKRKIEYKKYLFVFALFILSLGFLSIYSFFRHFSKACIFADSRDEFTSVSSSAYSVALITLKDGLKSMPPKIDSAQIMYIKPNSSGSFILDIPTDYIFDMPGKYGDEEVSSILALGMLDSMGVAPDCSDKCLQDGVDYLESSFKVLTGYSVDRWVLIDTDILSYVEGLVFQGDGIRVLDKNNARLLSDSMKTNFTFSEFLSHYNNLRTVEARNIRKVTFTSPDSLDSDLRELNYNSQLASQGFSIAILNATKTSGVASYGSRVVKNAGGYVTSVANASAVAEDTFIVTDNNESYAVEFLKKYFKTSKVFSKKDSPLEDSAIQRADITLVIGLDFLTDF